MYWTTDSGYTWSPIWLCAQKLFRRSLVLYKAKVVSDAFNTLVLQLELVLLYLILRGVAHFFISTNEMPGNKGKSKKDKEIELKQIGFLLKCFVACMQHLQYHSKVSWRSTRCESLLSTRFSIPAWVKNKLSWIERIESCETENERSPMSDFLLIFQHWNDTKWHGLFLQAFICLLSKQDLVKWMFQI